MELVADFRQIIGKFDTNYTNFAAIFFVQPLAFSDFSLYVYDSNPVGKTSWINRTWYNSSFDTVFPVQLSPIHFIVQAHPDLTPLLNIQSFKNYRSNISMGID